MSRRGPKRLKLESGEVLTRRDDLGPRFRRGEGVVDIYTDTPARGHVERRFEYIRVTQQTFEVKSRSVRL